MIVVIQCAARKRLNAGCFRTNEGKQVLFVARPDQAPPASDRSYARPDDPTEEGFSWRELVVRYNKTPDDNPFGLLPAYELYDNDAYRNLASRVGVGNTFILSAGWGLIAASFLTPRYDVTFSAAADGYKRRLRDDPYRDLNLMPEGLDAPMLFFGGKDYLPLFSRLTSAYRGSRVVFYNSIKRPDVAGCRLQRFDTTTRTNWHYECARAFLDGGITCAAQ